MTGFERLAPDSRWELALLGPLEVRRDEQTVAVPPGRPSVLLAALAMSAGSAVDGAVLVRCLWPEDESLPENPRGAVHTYVGRLRAILGKHAITSSGGSYRLEVDAEAVDLHRFRKLTADRDSGDPIAELANLQRALTLWRGKPFSGLVPDALAREYGPGLTDELLAALERANELRLGAGLVGADMVSSLRRLVQEYPARERLWMQLMEALHRQDRRAEALDTFRELTDALREGFGLDPGPAAVALHRRLLALDDTADGPWQDSMPAEPSDSRPPAQLPSVSTVLVGRNRALDQVVGSILGTRTPRPAGVVPVVVINGLAGAGKTSLALLAAHQMTERFGDGQLFADLRGHSASAPESVERVLGKFLRGLGMTPAMVPAELDDLAAAFRSLVAGRRILVVLDNVSNEEQVRHLLPGSTTCAVLVTSRHDLAGLEVSPGARRISVGTLDVAQSYELLTGLLGAERTAVEADAVAELAHICGGLPLALRVAAAHLTLSPRLGVADYVRQLLARGTVSGLRVVGDEQANLSAAFDWSYRTLPPTQQRLLRLCGLIPGTDFAAVNAAAAAGLDLPTAAGWLEELASAGLVERREDERFGLHDLIRAYAVQRSRTEDSENERTEARRRLMQAYIRQADRVLVPRIGLRRLVRPTSVDDLGLQEIRAGSSLSGGDDPDEELAELDRDCAAMVEAVIDAADNGPYDAAYHLADALRGYPILRGYAGNWLACVDAGLRAAERDRSDEAIAAMLNSRGLLWWHLADDKPRAFADLTAALELCERIRSDTAYAIRANLGNLALFSGQPWLALEHNQAALEGYGSAASAPLRTIARRNLIMSLISLGELERARTELHLLVATVASLTYRDYGLVALMAATTGDLTEAIAQYQVAVDDAVRRGDRRGELASHIDLVVCQLERDDDIAAAERTAERIAERVQREEPRLMAETDLMLAHVAYRAGRLTEARLRFTRASEATELGQEQQCAALIGHAELELAEANVAAGIELAERATELARRASFQIRLVHSLSVLGAGCRLNADLRTARKYVEQARSIATSSGYRLGLGVALTELADIEQADGRPAAALDLRREAHELLRLVHSRRAPVLAAMIAQLP
ncbi:AfsR/SARP family transcriptional regulator [Tenggerimyces flavus]|uniref:BTAD domain-containing putative transcriptional regulator n=1 Tax=Tenggerimyces flavus TaxID=1708749 RepID=A0ABV7YQL4_9ACTN|nr:AfsR/SARP family transcriptional regulator [Tenggerimyces flavus]MBM7790142.1 DNA-binding SARP family transcriptional activator [Tenggerimyces flavus]